MVSAFVEVDQGSYGIPAPPEGWPEPLGEAAFHGIAGEIARTIAPHSEADPVALLGQALAAAGSALGRHAYFEVEAARHYANLYVAIVGDSAKARKGTSLAHIERIVGAADPAWYDSCLAAGLSTGEGLIWAVRDPIKSPAGEEGGPEKILDEGVADKRLLVVEPELARTLRVIERDGNTLSPVLRGAWDTGRMRILTKTSPAQATGAHISVIGHITGEELRRRLTETEIAAGLANRVLFLAARRSQLLPDGGAMNRENVAPLVRRLSKAIAARIEGRVAWDRGARELWHAEYANLSAGRPGLHGVVTARAEAQVVRLALLYALLDGVNTISETHLRAALALWQYADQSARFLFGTSLGDPVADEILSSLRGAGNAGVTRTELRDLFARHRGVAEIGRALDLLERHGLAYRRMEGTGGRPAERWLASSPATKATEATKVVSPTATTATKATEATKGGASVASVASVATEVAAAEPLEQGEEDPSVALDAFVAREPHGVQESGHHRGEHGDQSRDWVAAARKESAREGEERPA